MTKLSINGHNLFVEKAGHEDGRAIILMHHGLGSLKLWRIQIPVLDAHGYRVIVYDRWDPEDQTHALDFQCPFSKKMLKI